MPGPMPSSPSIWIPSDPCLEHRGIHSLRPVRDERIGAQAVDPIDD